MNILPLVADILTTEPGDIETVLETFSIPEIISLLQLSAWCKKPCEKVLRRRLSTRKIYDKFFETAAERLSFAHLHRKTDFYIGGSQALQFFNNEVWQQSDLDIYCWPLTEAPVLTALSGLGYNQSRSATAPVAPPEMYYPDRREICRVINLYRDVGGGLKCIQVVTCVDSPLKTILQFHSTAVMNFLTWQYAVCLFPFHTLQMKATIVCHGDNDALEKYERRGFTLLSDVSPEHIHSEIRPGVREVGDCHSLIVQYRDKDPITNKRAAYSNKTSLTIPSADEIVSASALSFDGRLTTTKRSVDIFLNSWNVQASFDVGSVRYKSFTMNSCFAGDVQRNLKFICSETVMEYLQAVYALEGKISGRKLKIVENALRLQFVAKTDVFRIAS